MMLARSRQQRFLKCCSGSKIALHAVRIIIPHCIPAYSQNSSSKTQLTWEGWGWGQKEKKRSPTQGKQQERACQGHSSVSHWAAVLRNAQQKVWFLSFKCAAPVKPDGAIFKTCVQTQLQTFLSLPLIVVSLEHTPLLPKSLPLFHALAACPEAPPG